MSTVSPGASRELSRRVRTAGATMVDAPVSGGVTAAETGTLAIMVGGTEAGYRAAEALLLRLGRTVTHVGGNGQGLVLDLALNISTAAQMLAFHEGEMLAAHGGIDPTVTARAMTEFANGPAMDTSRLPFTLVPAAGRPGATLRACARASASRWTPRARPACSSR